MRRCTRACCGRAGGPRTAPPGRREPRRRRAGARGSALMRGRSAQPVPAQREPPSTVITWPVMYESGSSSRRHDLRDVPAGRSEGSLPLDVGVVLARRRSTRAPCPRRCAPGATTLTRMSAAPPYSLARMRAACSSRCLGARVGKTPFERCTPCMLEKSTIAPFVPLAHHVGRAGAGQQHRRLVVGGERGAQRGAVEVLGLHARGIARESDQPVTSPLTPDSRFDRLLAARIVVHVGLDQVTGPRTGPGPSAERERAPGGSSGRRRRAARLPGAAWR